MLESQPIPNPEAEMQNAVKILTAIQDCRRFQISVEDGDMSRVQLLYGDQLSTSIYYPTGDFLSAVDYYYKNRDSETSVDLAMQRPDGVVNVWSPFKSGNDERKVVVSIKNQMVPRILEFAYLILRAKDKKAIQSNPPADSPKLDTSR